MTQQQQPLYRRRFFPLFRNFTFLVFGRGKKNVWRLTALKRTMTNMTNTQIRPKRRLKHHSGREIGGSFTFRDSASFLRFSSSPRSHTTSTSIKSAAHDSIISGADVSIGARFLSYNRGIGSHQWIAPAKKQQTTKVPARIVRPLSRHARPPPESDGLRLSLSHVSSVAHSFR